MRDNLVYLAVMVVAVAVLACASGAWADVIVYKGVGLNSEVKLHASGLLGDGLTVPAGQCRIEYQDRDYLSYCVDLDHYAGSGEVTEIPVGTLNRGNWVAFLFDTYSGTVDSGLEAAALGTAIWEVLYETDTDLDVTDGYFNITQNDAVAAAANDLLVNLPSDYTPAGGDVVLHSESRQDLLIGGFEPIPEPTTLALIALASVVLLRRRTIRKRI